MKLSKTLLSHAPFWWHAFPTPTSGPNHTLTVKLIAKHMVSYFNYCLSVNRSPQIRILFLRTGGFFFFNHFVSLLGFEWYLAVSGCPIKSC